ncbi:MAG: right-handed parallel beta-helix repeat-containing protein [Phycisphaerae bacterium]|nr:right-handed parallel beta-helix repeat-containing protein [Phycisphaerae bacterium]
MNTPLAVLLLSALAPDPAPVVVVDRDNVVITADCTVRIPAGTVIADADGDGVIHIAAPCTVRFEPGSVLRGSAPGARPDTIAGAGIRITSPGVTLAGADGAPIAVEGFRIGIHATGADGLTIDHARLDHLWRPRLASTPQAEASGDWLWPHENDANQWRTNYGGAVIVERAANVSISNTRVRRAQNGIILDRVTASRIFDNDASFLSGWGLALWRASHNTVSRNAFDFCIRGYSHGVYNRGQDSAGILAFEQCTHNTFIENSATHGGDGFFGFAGKEALGEKPPPSPDFSYAARGNTNNAFIGNDFSYAAAHGLELTFSFGNLIAGNRFVENAICGIWGGYSSATTIVGNRFTGNGDAGYGLERGGINIEHGSRNVIASNTFERNACGVHLWWDEDAGIAKLPWAAANGVGSEDNWLQDNVFTADTVAVHLRKTKRTSIRGHTYERCRATIQADADSDIVDAPKARPMPEPDARPLGVRTPIGARAALAGRHNIIMTEWGPWSHDEPLVRLAAARGASDVYEFFQLPDDTDVTIDAPPEVQGLMSEPQAPGGPVTLSVAARAPGLYEYALKVSTPPGAAAPFQQTARGTLIASTWSITVFPSDIDPRTDRAAWLVQARGPSARTAERATLDLPYANGGPSQVNLSEEITAAKLPRDRFGTLASTRIPLPAGRYRITTLSDDGVRVSVRFGGLAGLAEGAAAAPITVIENWTHHGPTTDRGEFEVPGPVGAVQVVELSVEHFELDGYAVLRLGLERVPPAAGPPAGR